MAARTGISSAHLSNLVAVPPMRDPGDDVIHRLAAHWRTTYGALEEEACGVPGAGLPRGTEGALPPAIAAVVRAAKALGRPYSQVAIDNAWHATRGVGATFGAHAARRILDEHERAILVTRELVDLDGFKAQRRRDRTTRRR